MSLIGRKWESTDPGAPMLTGDYGSMIDVLRAVLVEGYGSGDYAKAPAGWTEEFKGGGNVAVFRNNPVTGMGCYVRVDDSDYPETVNPDADGRHACIRAFKTMSTRDAGTDMMPSESEQPLGAFIFKHLSAWPAAVPWVIFANERAMWLFIGPVRDEMTPYFIGDFSSDVEGDQFAFALCASSKTINMSGYLDAVFLATVTDQHDFWVLRAANLAPGCVHAQIEKLSLWTTYGFAWVGGFGSAFAYPDPVSGGARFAQPFFRDTVGIRGRLLGMWAPLHDKPLADGQLITGAPGIPDVEVKTYMAFEGPSPTIKSRGQIAIEVGVEWK